MTGLLGAVLTLTSLAVEPPPPPRPQIDYALEARDERDVLGDLAASFDGVPVPIVDPFQAQVMVEVHGTF